MRALLGLAAIGAIAAISPAQGQGVSASSFSVSSGLGDIRFRSGSRPHGVVLRESGSGHRRHIHVGDRDRRDDFGFGYPYYDGDYDANRSFDPDKWNDWWHERPERAFPRWMSRNQDCARPWYSGNVLTC